MESFLVIPLSLGSYDLGALTLMAPDPGQLDRHISALAAELADQLAQILHTNICSDEVRIRRTRGLYVVYGVTGDRPRGKAPCTRLSGESAPQRCCRQLGCTSCTPATLAPTRRSPQLHKFRFHGLSGAFCQNSSWSD